MDLKELEISPGFSLWGTKILNPVPGQGEAALKEIAHSSDTLAYLVRDWSLKYDG